MLVTLCQAMLTRFQEGVGLVLVGDGVEAGLVVAVAGDIGIGLLAFPAGQDMEWDFLLGEVGEHIPLMGDLMGIHIMERLMEAHMVQN